MGTGWKNLSQLSGGKGIICCVALHEFCNFYLFSRFAAAHKRAAWFWISTFGPSFPVSKNSLHRSKSTGSLQQSFGMSQQVIWNSILLSDDFQRLQNDFPMHIEYKLQAKTHDQHSCSNSWSRVVTRGMQSFLSRYMNHYISHTQLFSKPKVSMSSVDPRWHCWVI